MTTRLPVLLENLRIASPCRADWDEMRGDERVRFCGRCEKNVYNLSAMTRAEAEMLVREPEGRLCVRLYQRSDGTVLTTDCPVGVRRQRWRQRAWASICGATASLSLALGLFAGRARADLTVADGKPVTHPQPQQPDGGAAKPSPPPEPLMGKIARVPAVTPRNKPQAKMGEPGPMMGETIAYEPKKK